MSSRSAAGKWVSVGCGGPPLNTQVGKSLLDVELGLEREGGRYRGSWDRQELAGALGEV